MSRLTRLFRLSSSQTGFAMLPLLIVGAIIIIGAAALLSTNVGQNLITGPLPASTLNQLYEAESFTLKSPMSIGGEAGAFSGKYISANSGAKTQNPTSEATLSVSVPAAGTYYLWVRTLAPSKSQDASYVGIDSSWDRVFPANIGIYEWVKVKTANNGVYGFNLAQGTHVLKLGHGELGVHLDAVYLSTNPNAALPAPTATGLYEAESFTLISPMTTGGDVNAFNGQYISANTGVATNAPAREASLSVNVPLAGTYYLWARIYAATKSNDAFYVGINSSWDRVFPTATGTYEWVKVAIAEGTTTQGFALAAGANIFQVGHGELLARLDALFLSTDPNATPPILSATPPPPAPAPLPTISLSASPTSIISGQSSTLTWTSTDATSCTASGGWAGTKLTSGSEVVSPTITTTYTLACTGAGGSVSKSVTISVSAPADTTSPAVSISSPTTGTSYTSAQTVSIQATASDNVGVTKVEFYDGTALKGTDITVPYSYSWSFGSDSNGIHSFTAKAYDAAGNVKVSAAVSLTVNIVTTPAPTVSLSASPTSITSGQSSTLTWTSTDATSCTASGGWAGTKLTSGSEVVSPTITTTYTLACTGAGGSVSKSVTISVSAPADTTSPAVSISSPTTGTSYTSAQTVSIQATASDNVGVTKVEFYDGATLKGTDTSSPYSYSWAFTSADNGTHPWTAKAYDAAGNTKVSGVISLTVNIAVITPPPPSGAYEGFGGNTTGGAGKPIYYVTNLNDSGAGSLRDAVSQGNRYIKFLVGGTINLASDINVQGANITVDGLSAPNPGITITNQAFLLKGTSVHDVIVTGIRSRNAALDAFGVRSGAHDIVFDHVSTYNAGDGGIDMVDLTGDKNEPLTNGQGTYNVTVQWSLIAENPAHNLISITSYGANRSTYHHNLFINATSRNPQLSWKRTWDPPFTIGDVRNNLIWNFSDYGSTVLHGAWGNVVNNYYQSSSQTQPNRYVQVKTDVPYATSRAYVKGNVSQGVNVNIDSMSNASTPFSYVPVNQTDACTAAKAVKANAGAKGPNFGLDSIDQARINSVNITCI